MIQALHPPPEQKKPSVRPDPGIARTLRRIEKDLRNEHRKLGLPLVVWKNGRVCKIKA